MKIVLVNLPWKKGRFWGVRAGSRWPHIKTLQEKNYSPFPFFLAYAAALLKRENFEVKLIDALAEEIHTPLFLKMVVEEKPNLLVAETSTPSLYNDLEILKKVPNGIPIALCGPEANIRTLDFLSQNKFIDFVFIGEYEYTLLELAQRLKKRKNLDGLLGLIYRSKADLKINPARPLVEELDMLPWPIRESLPMERYNDNPGGIPVPSVQMWTSRGCPYQCTFCVWPQLMYRKNRYRIRSITKVVDEMGYLVRNMGFKSIYFDDDTTNIGKLRMLELSKEIKRRRLNVPWAMMARADLMDEEILDSLKAAGLYAVKYGVESAEQGLLDRIHKNMDIEKTERMIRFTKSLGIKTHLAFTFGLPGETAQTIQKTVDLAIKLNPDSVQFSITTPFPGTQYFDDLNERGYIVSRICSDYDGNSKSVLRTESLGPKELEKAKQYANKIWRVHLWQTRYNHFRFKDYIKKLFSITNHKGSYVSFSKLMSFTNYKLKEVKFNLFGKYKLLSNNFLRFKASINNRGIGHTYKKIRNHYLDILGIFNGYRAFKGPSCVQIDLTNKCNNNCIGCWCNSPLLANRAYRGSKKYTTLPTPMVKTLIDELAGLGTNELYFSGAGEPFMHPDLLSIIEYAKQRGMLCSINTNFTLVNESIVKKLIELNIDYLTVSIWAGTPQIYTLTHPNKDEATFYRLRNLLRMLNSLKTNCKPHIKIYNVICNINFRELEKMVGFAKDTGCDAVEFTVVDTIPQATDILILSQEERRIVLEQCERMKRNTGTVQILNLEHFMRRLSDPGATNAQYDSEFINIIPCYIGWLFSRIMPNGDVNFCLKAHRIPVGNLYEKTFWEIWNSQRQMEFRQKTLMDKKGSSFFRLIGNDPNCKIGCYKSCDDIGRNLYMHKKITSLNPFLKFILKNIENIYKCPK
jgi:radical SAM superfamily enzyme YgiQ (UPF0313 family)/MoaA/NifB/PqqE/SkfB family radical SAM enzyme